MNVVSIVIPLYNEEELIPELMRRLKQVEEKMTDICLEIIPVDDGSADGTREALERSLSGFSRWKLVSLARNFGLQPAYKAGLDHATGDAIVFMDGDLQDPPEVIPALLKEWKAGAKVVTACRNSRKETGVRRICFDVFHIIFHKLTGGIMPKNSGMFGLMDQVVADQIRMLPERNLFFPALRCWPGFKQSCVYYDRDARFSGYTKQSFTRLFRYAWDGITSFSDVPLQFITFMGIVISALAFIFGGALVLFRILQLFGLFGEQVVLGFTSIITAVLFMGGLQMIAIGVIGNYMSRLYHEVKHRPHYIVGDVKESVHSE